MSLLDVHNFMLALVEPTLAMTERGVLVDEQRRQEMLATLEAKLEPLKAEAEAIALPLIEAGWNKLEKPHLYEYREPPCECCRHGAKKQRECWSCAGFEKSPTKKQLTEAGVELGVCAVCGGEPRAERRCFSSTSNEQVKDVLYKLLKLPKHFKKGKLKADEETLKDLLAHDTSGFVERLLKINKTSTMIGIFGRTEPGEDSRLRTFYNVAGTETGRFSSSGGRPFPRGSELFALEVSTNLQNFPKKTAALDPDYDVRRCVVPDAGYAFLQGDLSQAEARVVAALCGDTELLERWQQPEFDVHKWTAAHIYEVAPDQISKKQRSMGKTSRHALNYGMGAKLFQQRVNFDADITGLSLTFNEAQRIRNAYHKLHPKLAIWWQSVLDKLEAGEPLTTVFGREFYSYARLDGWLGSAHKANIARVPQSTVADLLNTGLLRWWQQHDPHEGKLVMQIHDAVMLLVKRGNVARAAKLLRACLEIPLTINGIELLIPADIEVGYESWGEMQVWAA